MIKSTKNTFCTSLFCCVYVFDGNGEDLLKFHDSSYSIAHSHSISVESVT